MLAYNIGSDSAILRLAFVGLMVLLAAAVLIALGAFLGRLAGGKTKGKTRFLCLLPTAAAILVSIAGFICNIGWCRIILIFALVPLWYTMLLTVSASASAPAIKQSYLIRTCYILSHVFYVLSGLVLPDVGDEGPSYVFFGMINSYPDELFGIAAVLFIASIATMIVQIVAAAIIKKRQQTESVIR